MNAVYENILLERLQLLLKRRKVREHYQLKVTRQNYSPYFQEYADRLYIEIIWQLLHLATLATELGYGNHPMILSVKNGNYHPH